MSKTNWKPIDLMDVIGMASNPVNPGTKYAKRLLNVYPHQRPGALTLRPGYAPKYTKPSDSTITSPTYLNFGVFFDRQADPEGREIIVEVQKGIVTALLSADEPIVENTFQGFQFWVRPYWDGVQWLNNWQWLNKTIITKITAVDVTYPSHIKIFGNLTHGLQDDSLIGWTIYNQTKNQYAKIITCKLESPDLWLNITLYDNGWEVDDVIIASRFWIDIDVQLELYSNVEKEDIVFHNINNDIRIGFGGEENRPGIAIGYRKISRLIKMTNFSNVHPDLATTEAFEKFSTFDGMVLDTATLGNGYGIELASEFGALPENKHYFRLTGKMDGYAEQMLAEANIYIDGTEDISIRPFVVLGKDNIRITDFKLYASTDNITFYLISQYKLSADEYEQPTLIIDESGKLYVDILRFEQSGEFHSDSNAISVASESDSIGDWVNYASDRSTLGPTTVVGMANYGAVFPQDGGSYLFEWKSRPGSTGSLWIISPFLIAGVQLLKLQFKIFADYNFTLKIKSTLTGGDYVDLEIMAGVWNVKNINLYVSGSLVLYTQAGIPLPLNQVIALDSFSVTNPDGNAIVYGTEMSSEMGYNPTMDVVRGWDQALLMRGRVYYLNPYVEKRYENFLLVSHIAPPNTFMWDISSFSNFRELERHDSSQTIAITLLPNNDILILKDSSVTALSDDGRVGVVREPVYGVDCISPSSVVNINGIIFWCGKEEIYMLNIGRSLIPEPMLKNTIRDLYLAITDKSKIFGTRNRYNTYRIRINDEQQKLEFLLVDTGWVEERKWLFPEIYRGGFNNRLYFLNEGNIYEENVDFSLPQIQYGEEVAE